MESPATADTSDAETATAKPSSHESPAGSDDDLSAEVEKLRALAAEKEAAERELANKYNELQSKHGETLDLVEELKTEVSKAKAAEASSPRGNAPVIRRKSSQNVMIIDRAHRSFASLRNIAAENFEGQPDVMQNFELNLNAAMHELHSRSERIQELEADIAAAKKEMETKMTIISGLTRERSSLQASPRDMSVVSALRDQLEQSEEQLKSMREAHEAREKELSQEIESLRAALEEKPTEKPAEGGIDAETARAQKEKIAQLQADLAAWEEKYKALDVAAAGSREAEATPAPDAAQAEKIARLEADLAVWEDKHKAALDNLKTTEENMQQSIDDIEAQLAEANAKLADSQARESEQRATAEVQEEHQKMVQLLQGELDEYKAIVNSNATKVAELEAAHAAARSELDEAVKARDEASEARRAAEAEAAAKNELVATLEAKVEEYEQTARSHQESLQALHASHAKELEELKGMEQRSYEEQVSVLMNEHSESVRILESELDDARQELGRVATRVASALGVSADVERITERIGELIADQKALGEEQKKRADIEANMVELSSINDTVMRDLESVRAMLDEIVGPSDDEPANGASRGVVARLQRLKKHVEELESGSKKHSRLVEELEEQLAQNFDQAQITTNRLSTLQSERNAQLEEANAARNKLQAELDAAREEYAALQAKYEELANPETKRSNSMSSQLRKSSSVASLPSPPPAIPLPPLPVGGGSGVPPAPSSPTSASRPMSKDNMAAISQIREDQEARIRTIEKHLGAEKQLTATLEEALSDLEKQSKKVKSDCDAWKKRAGELEAELREMKEREQQGRNESGTPVADNRWSLQAVEEERKKRQAAEAARAQLEERMKDINKKKKKKGSLNCF
ncbi:hypothetical protein VUR80DRAFT_3435 [Thermomyces stellatus]